MSGVDVELPDGILVKIQTVAREEQVSVDQLLVDLIADGLGQRHTLRHLRERAARADVAAALRLLQRAPDRPADPGDELPSVL